MQNKKGENLFRLFRVLPFSSHNLFENQSDADADVVVHTARRINRVVIDLDGAKIYFVVDFNVEASAESSGKTRIGKRKVPGAGNHRRTIAGCAGDVFRGKAVDAGADQRVRKRL